MSDWTNLVEKEVLSTRYLLSISKLSGWGREYEEQMDYPEWGEKLNVELNNIGCESMNFYGNGDFMFSLELEKDEPVTWSKIEKVFTKYISMLDS